jgi:acyl carrier protein
MTKITEFLIDYLEQRGETIELDKLSRLHLTQDNILDSFGMITLFMAIEDAFDVKITPIDMLEDENKTLSGLAKLIQDRLN